MAKFLYVYKGGGMARTEEEQKAAMAAWGAWFEQLGSAITDPGNPVGATKVVSSNGTSDGGGAGAATGYTLIEADSLDAAAELAKSCPIFEVGGTVEVGETIAM